MTIDLRPWRRLMAVWLPAVALCAVTAAFYVWQTSESGGRRAQIRGEIDDFEQKIARLEQLQQAAASDRETVTEIDRQFDKLYSDVFGDLDERLTRILRAVGSATARRAPAKHFLLHGGRRPDDRVHPIRRPLFGGWGIPTDSADAGRSAIEPGVSRR